KLQPKASSSGTRVCAASDTAKVGNISSKKCVLKWPTPVRMRTLRALRAGKPRSMNAAKLPEGVGVYKRGFRLRLVSWCPVVFTFSRFDRSSARAALVRSPSAPYRRRETEEPMAMPLDGIRVIDWTIWQQGPFCSAMLGDLGAQVNKIEEPGGGDPGRGMAKLSGVDLGDRPNFYFEANNRNKRGLTVDLKKPEAREIIYRLVEKSDAFVQNFRKGVAGRLGLRSEE